MLPPKNRDSLRFSCLAVAFKLTKIKTQRGYPLGYLKGILIIANPKGIVKCENYFR